MLLAVDVGNTQSTLGIYDGEKLLNMWRIATNKSHTSDELRAKLLPLFRTEDFNIANGWSSVLASVVPPLTTVWCEALQTLTGKPPVVCTAESAAGLFEADYPSPSEIGADRVADAVAAKALFGAPVVVVDFGTATNIEVIDRRGKFVGGVIAPGVETSAAALFANATRLATIDLVDPHTAIGTSTEKAIQAGIVYGEADRVDGLLRRIFEQLGEEVPVVLTGGLAKRMADYLHTPNTVHPELTLEGLRLIAAQI